MRALKALIGMSTKDGILSIFCCNDGSIEQLGKVLQEHYNTVEKLTPLLNLGDVISVDGPNLQEVVTVATGSDKERIRRVHSRMNLRAWYQHLEIGTIDFLYLFDETQEWQVSQKNTYAASKIPHTQKLRVALDTQKTTQPTTKTIRIGGMELVLSDSDFNSLVSQVVALSKESPFLVGEELIWWRDGKPHERPMIFLEEKDSFLLLMDNIKQDLLKMPASCTFTRTGNRYKELALCILEGVK